MNTAVDSGRPLRPASTPYAARSRAYSLVAGALDGAGSEGLDEAQQLSLMRRVAERDVAAYRELVEVFLPRIARFAQRFLGNAAEAEDVAQETFLRLWTGAASLRSDTRAGSWLYRVAHNLCVDRWRKRRTESELRELPGSDRPSGLFARKETAEAVRAALAELPQRQRAAIVLVHYEGLAAQEAASVLEISVEALESLLARARRSLRERLAGLAAEPHKELR